ncbi:MAG: cupin domain-containing protein [Candidatus Marinimicrobia bacterium]|nr:cupin domain-containing protein [Candidatus Neomarinimicrobiota bacterium]
MNYKKTTVDYKNLPEWVTFLRKNLNLKGVGVGLIHLLPGKGYRFLHQHKEQEEVYFILEGQGIIHIDGEDVAVTKGDIIKIDPKGNRALKAADDSDLVAICIGGVPKTGYPQNPESKSLIDDGIPDYDNPPHWYANDKYVINYLKNLKEKQSLKT